MKKKHLQQSGLIGIDDNKRRAKANQTNTKKKIVGITFPTLGRVEFKSKYLKRQKKAFLKFLNDKSQIHRNFNDF